MQHLNETVILKEPRDVVLLMESNRDRYMLKEELVSSTTSFPQNSSLFFMLIIY
jgi:hypothetical protein